VQALKQMLGAAVERAAQRPQRRDGGEARFG